MMVSNTSLSSFVIVLKISLENISENSAFISRAARTYND